MYISMCACITLRLKVNMENYHQSFLKDTLIFPPLHQNSANMASWIIVSLIWKKEIPTTQSQLFALEQLSKVNVAAKPQQHPQNPHVPHPSHPSLCSPTSSLWSSSTDTYMDLWTQVQQPWRGPSCQQRQPKALHPSPPLTSSSLMSFCWPELPQHGSRLLHPPPTETKFFHHTILFRGVFPKNSHVPPQTHLELQVAFVQIWEADFSWTEELGVQEQQGGGGMRQVLRLKEDDSKTSSFQKCPSIHKEEQCSECQKSFSWGLHLFKYHGA